MYVCLEKVVQVKQFIHLSVLCYLVYLSPVNQPILGQNLRDSGKYFACFPEIGLHMHSCCVIARIPQNIVWRQGISIVGHLTQSVSSRF